MSWNYRMVEKIVGGSAEVGIYSVYYDAQGRPNSVSVDPASVNHYSIEGLATTLEMMKEGLAKPLLVWEEIGREMENEPEPEDPAVEEESESIEPEVLEHFVMTDVRQAQLDWSLKSIRKAMLKYSYSYVPVQITEEWKWVSDYNLAIYLALVLGGRERKKRLRQKLSEALANGLVLEDALIYKPTTLRPEALAGSLGRPVLVMEQGNLRGVVTFLDLLR